jgi:sulfur-carrier protein
MRMGIVSGVAEPVTVELFGTARLRAGRPELRASGRTVGELLRSVIAECPALDVLQTGGGLSRHYLISLDGERFVDDPAQMVPPGSRVLILGADAGG